MTYFFPTIIWEWIERIRSTSKICPWEAPHGALRNSDWMGDCHSGEGNHLTKDTTIKAVHHIRFHTSKYSYSVKVEMISSARNTMQNNTCIDGGVRDVQ